MMVLVAPSKFERGRDGAQPLVAVAHVRLMVLMLLFAAALLSVVGRLGILAASAEPRGAKGAAAGSAALRGDLVDRNGVPLARTILAPAIGVRPDKVIGDKRQLAQRLAALLPEHDAAYYLALLNGPPRFVYLRRRATPELVTQVNALGEPGITFPMEPERLYTQSSLAANAIGFVDDSGRGKLGMERYLDTRLTAPGAQDRPVALSIDIRVQAALRAELDRAMADFKAKAAAGIVLDAETGEVMAMVSLPTFNPNAVTPADVTDRQAKPMFNRVTMGNYELGSTFKPITMAAAIDDGVVTSMARRYDAREPLEIGRFHIRDDHPQKRWLNVPETLVHSSNIVTARIADEMGADRMKAVFQSLGFMAPVDIEIEHRSPMVPAYWGRTTTMTTGYGHGIAVTPLHLAMAYAALVNGGRLRPATLLKLAPGQVPAGTQVFAPETSYRIRQLLRLVALDGTGRKGDAPGYRVGGKTGTAERVDTEHGGYSSKVNVSTFAAAFPMDAPRYVVIAMIDSPVGNASTFGLTTAAWTAAPVVSRVIQRTGPMLGVLPDMGQDINVSALTPLLWHPPGESKAMAEAE